MKNYISIGIDVAADFAFLSATYTALFNERVKLAVAFSVTESNLLWIYVGFCKI